MKTVYDYLANNEAVSSGDIVVPFDYSNALCILHTVEDNKEIVVWKCEKRLIFEKIIGPEYEKRRYIAEIKFDEDGFPYCLHELTSDLVDGECIKTTEIHSEYEKNHISAYSSSVAKDSYYKHYIFEHDPVKFTLKEEK